MLKYKLSSTDRSKQCVEDVTEVFVYMSYDSTNCVTPVTWYETLIMFPRDAIFATSSYAVFAVITVLNMIVTIWCYVRVFVTKG